jgi:outer membrane biosynthesis protein TonB
MSERKAYLWMGTGPLALIIVAGALLVISNSTPARAVAFALFGIACVIAISLVFLAVGQSEDDERAAERPPPPEPEPPPPEPEPPPPEPEPSRRPEKPPEKHPPPVRDHERPAIARRRPRPPRRPS